MKVLMSGVALTAGLLLGTTPVHAQRVVEVGVVVHGGPVSGHVVIAPRPTSRVIIVERPAPRRVEYRDRHWSYGRYVEYSGRDWDRYHGKKHKKHDRDCDRDHDRDYDRDRDHHDRDHHDRHDDRDYHDRH